MANKIDIKTIDVHAKEWFDKQGGNSYFAAVITLNFGLPDCKQISIPFQYGYGDYYLHKSLHVLRTGGWIPDREFYSLWKYCEEFKIPLRTHKDEKCLKRELTQHTAYLIG